MTPSDAATGTSLAATSNHDAQVPPALSAAMRHGWSAVAPLQQRLDVGDAAGPPGAAGAAAAHRRRLAAALPGAVVVLSSGSPVRRSGDQPHPFRPDSDFVWLTGCQEQDVVLVMETDDPDGATLYRRPGGDRCDDTFWLDRRHGELWTGRRPDNVVMAQLTGLRCLPPEQFATGRGSVTDADLRRVVAGLRAVKDDWEIAELEAAVDTTVRGFRDVVEEWDRVRAHGERWAEVTFWRRARLEGNGTGYAAIVAGGAHSTTLHWTRNDGPVRDGDVVLLDLGAEARSLYTADVTRVLPADGRFSDEQRAVHDLVLAAHDAAAATLVPGAAFAAAHRAAVDVLARGLIDLGLLTCSVDEALDPTTQAYRRYSLCGSGHLLGLDVHDCGEAAPEDYVDGRLAVGTVLTVEPGLYFQPDDRTVPPGLRGIGMRVEDDYVVERAGARRLTAALPRTASEIESWMSSPPPGDPVGSDRPPGPTGGARAATRGTRRD